MFSTYAIREIEKHVKKFNPAGYYFKDVAINARSPENETDPYERAFLKAVSNIQTKGNINPILTKDGRLRQIEWHDRTLKDENAHVLGLLCTGVDISERLEAEERRLALERQVQQAQKRESLATMAGAIAHHFNNQLSTVVVAHKMVVFFECGIVIGRSISPWV